MNDQERLSWVDNQETLYLIQQGSGQRERAFVREHRSEIDRVITHLLIGHGGSFADVMRVYYLDEQP